MELDHTIKTNQNALRRVVEEIFVYLELVLDGTIKRLPQIFHVMVVQLLVPAESALRRLIVIAARDIKVQIPPLRPMAKNQVIESKGSRPMNFQLFDTRKNFNRKPAPSKTIEPRIHFFGTSPLVATALAKRPQQKSSFRICRRFAAFKLALENIPLQAKRMALWQARRAAKAKVKFRFPLRPGAPPGLRRNRDHKIDQILRECQRLVNRFISEAPS